LNFDDENQSFDIGPLDPADPLPLYQQLRERLREVLQEGWPEDRPIPSERQLMQLTGLSRMTVRQAIADLVHEGMLRRDHGRGTFVSDSRIFRTLTGHSSFRQAVEQAGGQPSTYVARQRVIQASADQATLLQIEPGEDILDLVRVRLIDGGPALVDLTSIPLRLCPDIGGAELSGSLYHYLRTTCGVAPDHSVDTIEAVGAAGEISELLGVADGTPLTLMRRLALTIDDLPVEITEEYMRPDRCVYRLESPSGIAGIDLAGRALRMNQEATE
jgi:GntR family transcriptional regulator